jgi:Lrp/AsnC family transcriptional regulator for asnA, asnC and gidA
MCRDTAHFTDVLTSGIQSTEGVIRTETFLVLGIHKMTFGWGVDDDGVMPDVASAADGPA